MARSPNLVPASGIDRRSGSTRLCKKSKILRWCFLYFGPPCDQSCRRRNEDHISQAAIRPWFNLSLVLIHIMLTAQHAHRQASIMRQRDSEMKKGREFILQINRFKKPMIGERCSLNKNDAVLNRLAGSANPLVSYNDLYRFGCWNISWPDFTVLSSL